MNDEVKTELEVGCEVVVSGRASVPSSDCATKGWDSVEYESGPVKRVPHPWLLLSAASQSVEMVFPVCARSCGTEQPAVVCKDARFSVPRFTPAI